MATTPMPTSSEETGDHRVTAAAAPFPDADRVLYKRHTLVEVICQVRFPPVLRIQAELPAAFQDRVRYLFPLYAADDPGPLLSGQRIPDELLQVVGANLAELLQKRPRTFASADERWTLGLVKDFLALSTNSYTRWEQFREHLEPALDALEHVYKPSFYTRIGLRYRNVIRRSRLNLDAVGWETLLRPELAGELNAVEIRQRVEGTTCQTLVALPDFESKVRIRHGLSVEPGEKCYVIDNDFFTEHRTERSDVLGTLQYFNTQAHRLFRWCVTERLHAAMGPEPLV